MLWPEVWKQEGKWLILMKQKSLSSLPILMLKKDIQAKKHIKWLILCLVREQQFYHYFFKCRDRAVEFWGFTFPWINTPNMFYLICSGIILLTTIFNTQILSNFFIWHLPVHNNQIGLEQGCTTKRFLDHPWPVCCLHLGLSRIPLFWYLKFHARIFPHFKHCQLFFSRNQSYS